MKTTPRIANDEPRWHASVAVLIALALYMTLPPKVTFGPLWLLPLLVLGLLIPLSIVAPYRKNEPYYRHQDEGPDDLPAHLKSSILGNSLNIPITDGQPKLGTWQGIYLCEHRNHGGSRRLVVTIQGE